MGRNIAGAAASQRPAQQATAQDGSEGLDKAGVSAPTFPEQQDAMPFWQLVREDFATHQKDWTVPGFRALFVHRLGARRRHLPLPLRKLVGAVYILLHRYVRNHYGIELYATTRIGRRVKIAHQGGIVIHPLAEIDDGCVIRQGVTIGALNDTRVHEAPRLGRNVNVGAGAVIVGAVRIGNNVQIGPNCVVLTDVADDSLVAPAPVRTFRTA